MDDLFINNNADDVFNTLKSLGLKSVNKLIFAHLSGKFKALSYIIRDNIDILVVSESKLDPMFPACQFKITGYSLPYRRDRDQHVGGVMIFAREDISSKLLVKDSLPDDIEVLFVEINLRKTKFLLLGGYHPPSQPDHYFFDNINHALDLYRVTYDKIFLTGDFNAKESETCLSDFLYENDLKCIFKENTCLKNLFNPS